MSDRARPSETVHDWIRPVRVAYEPGPSDPILDHVVAGILRRLRKDGHQVQPEPGANTDAILTTAAFGEPVSWRRSLLFTARRRYRITHSPTVFTLMHATRAQFRQLLDHLANAIAKPTPDPMDFEFPGLAATAHRTLYEQGKRGGSIMALERLLQGQSKSVRVLLVVGDDYPEEAYHFDLVGAFPRSDGADPDEFYEDIVTRMATSLSTREVTDHEAVGEPLTGAAWDALPAPQAMAAASREFGNRGFFTEPVVISDLVEVPAISGAVAGQYSEGCFATYSEEIDAIVATVTGSARPIDKGQVTSDDLAVIVGIKPDGDGAHVRHISGHPNAAPSSEAVELAAMDEPLPRIAGKAGTVPVIRSKLHGHRGVASFDPAVIEYAPLAPAYHRYLVSCASEAQAFGVRDAFAGSAALRAPNDPRSLVFTVLPGHGMIIAEKWVPGTEPFQVIWEAMDRGTIAIESPVPQGPFTYVPGPDGRMVLSEQSVLSHES